MINVTNFGEKDFLELLNNITPQEESEIKAQAAKIRDEHFGKSVYTRGLIEFTNFCKQNCFYCGIRASNKNAERYRLTKDEILESCELGYSLGYRTFVLQGGEDEFFTTEKMCDIIREIKQKYPDCALTLSIGEKDYDTYKAYYEAGANRYLLRHETADEEHYNMLHPNSQSLQYRKQCLFWLKEIGFQVGAGFMVGSPYQKNEHLAKDLMFLKELKPHMVGIGPFISHKDTPFATFPNGSAEKTVLLVALTRLILPKALIPATTAMGTLDKTGREKAIKAGANVVMPNLSPLNVRNKYLLYDGKICTGDEAAECRKCLDNRIKSAGYEMDYAVGNHPDF